MCCCDCCSATQRKIWVYGCGSFFLVLGVVLAVLWPGLSTSIVHKNLVLQEGTESFDTWVETPIPVYLTFSLFNWTNPEHVRDKNVKPNFVEMGPYVFLEKNMKEDLDFHENNTVSYYERKWWHFQDNLSNGTLEDLVTSGHVISAAVADMMKHENKLIKMVMNHLLNTEGGQLYVTKPVREWIFDGYDDDLIDFINRLNSSRIHMPYTKFGWMVDRNNSKTFEGRFMINTGKDDVTERGLLTHWNESPGSGFYSGECDKVNGTSGDIYPVSLNTEKHISIFATDICRFLNLEPTGTATKHGLDGTVFTGNARSMGGVEYPEEQCFCPKDEECPKSGVLEVRKCRHDAPIYHSYPHFYSAHPDYLKNITGLKPQKELHAFEMTVEPTIGLTLEAHGRIQLNLMIQRLDDFDIYKGVNHFLLPLFWFENSAELDETYASKARLAINLSSYGSYFAYSLCAVGAVIISIAIVLTLTKKWKAEEADDLQPLSD